MSRTIEQINRSKETDSWKRHWHGNIGTTIGGTVNLSVDPINANDQQFITGLSFSSNLSGCEIDLLDGTAFLYNMKLQSATQFVDNFDLLKTSEGTALNIKLYNMWGTAILNVIGYTKK